jgi:hypothetical protein
MFSDNTLKTAIYYTGWPKSQFYLMNLLPPSNLTFGPLYFILLSSGDCVGQCV